MNDGALSPLFIFSRVHFSLIMGHLYTPSTLASHPVTPLPAISYQLILPKISSIYLVFCQRSDEDIFSDTMFQTVMKQKNTFFQTGESKAVPVELGGLRMSAK